MPSDPRLYEAPERCAQSVRGRPAWPLLLALLLEGRREAAGDGVFRSAPRDGAGIRLRSGGRAGRWPPREGS